MRLNPREWIGRDVTASESAMNSKAYKQLEANGLIERHNLTGGMQTTHLRLTPAGKIAAEHLAESLPNSAQTVRLPAGSTVGSDGKYLGPIVEGAVDG